MQEGNLPSTHFLPPPNSRGDITGIVAVRDAIPGATATWVECGHMVVQEKPGEVARILSRFLERYDGGVVLSRL